LAGFAAAELAEELFCRLTEPSFDLLVRTEALETHLVLLAISAECLRLGDGASFGTHD
jgi:hypothetical protein